MMSVARLNKVTWRPVSRCWVGQRQTGNLGDNRVAEGGKKHEHGQNEKAEERCKQKLPGVDREVKRDRRVYVE